MAVCKRGSLFEVFHQSFEKNQDTRTELREALTKSPNTTAAVDEAYPKRIQLTWCQASPVNDSVTKLPCWQQHRNRKIMSVEQILDIVSQISILCPPIPPMQILHNGFVYRSEAMASTSLGFTLLFSLPRSCVVSTITHKVRQIVILLLTHVYLVAFPKKNNSNVLCRSIHICRPASWLFDAGAVRRWRWVRGELDGVGWRWGRGFVGWRSVDVDRLRLLEPLPNAYVRRKAIT